MKLRHNRYQILILLLLGCFLAFSTWSALQARNHGSRITDVDYYSKGLKYNQTQLEKKAASVLGWRVESALDDRRLTVALNEGEQSISAANGVLFLYHNDTATAQRYPFKEDRTGQYSLQLPDTLHGTFRAQLEFEKQGARLSRQLLLSLPTATP